MSKLSDRFDRYLNGIMEPDSYHGFGKSGPFFEGWYFKLINSTGDQRWTVIPGVYIGAKPGDSHSFIQMMNGVNGKAYYIDYPYDQFRSDEKKFQTSIGRNEFSAKRIHLEIENDEILVEGDLTFNGLTPWPVTWHSPGIMGWFAWVPGMECYHGVVSLDHEIMGNLRINGDETDFSCGRGYIEKDWGKSMPKAWIWSQCNHFNKPHTSLTMSVAVVPWGPAAFDGFIVGLLLDGTLHRFATYTGARIEKETVSKNNVNLIFRDRNKRLEIIARRVGGGQLKAPTVTQMDRRISETLSSEIDVILSISENGTWHKVFEDSGRYAGLEVIGEL
jgi:tocopherol cyclase